MVKAEFGRTSLGGVAVPNNKSHSSNMVGRAVITAVNTSLADQEHQVPQGLVCSSSPLFNSSKSIVGYEIYTIELDREISAVTTTPHCGCGCLSSVNFEDSKYTNCNLIVIELPRSVLTVDLVDIFPCDQVVFSIHSTMQMDDIFVDRVMEMKSRGARFMLTDCRHDTNISRYSSFCTFISVNFSEDHGLNLGIVKVLKKYGFSVMASKITDWAMYTAAVQSGFDYFQGAFFTTVEFGPNKVKSLPQVKLQLIRQLSGDMDSIDVEEVTRTVSLDVQLSVRLLKMVNSAAFSLNQPVDSIRQAVRLLGLEQLKRWITMAFLSEQDETDKGHELVFRALHRAFFLNVLADSGIINGVSGEKSFLLGMLSCADAIFGVDMAELVEELQLPLPLKQALCREEGAELAWLVEMLNAIDANNGKEAREIMEQEGLDTLLTAKLYMNSSRVANDLLSKIQ